MYRIADCVNPKRQKVVHFNRLKPAPEGAEAPSPEVILRPSNKTAGEQNVMKIPLLTLQLVITMIIFNLPLYQWSLRIDNLSLGQLQMFQGQDQTRVRRPTIHNGDPVEIPETIQDEDLFG